MNPLPIPFGQHFMTVKEVSEALGVSERVVQLSAKRLYPAEIQNGRTTYLSETQVTAVKKDLQGHHNLEGTFEAATTALEISEMTLKVIQYHVGENQRLIAELAAAAPKVALADAVGRSDRQMSITDASKHFGLHPRLETLPYLRAQGYITPSGIPTQKAIDAGYLALKEAMAQDGRMWPQAVVEVWQLEHWRSHVVHQIKRFHQEMNA